MDLRTRRTIQLCWLGLFPCAAAVATPVANPVATATISSDSAATSPKQHPQPARELRQLQAEVERLKNRIDEQETERLALADHLAGDLSGALGGRDMFAIYGFFDTNFVWWIAHGKTRFLNDTDPGFVFGNLNTYLDFRPHSDWRVLAEVRFLLNPLGDIATYEDSFSGTTFQRVDVRTSEATLLVAELDHGSIEIERAHVTWQRYAFLRVTAGLFLTPYGILNIDHGSPTRVMVDLPTIYMVSLFSPLPERQLGLVADGQIYWRGMAFEYALTVSNGRGPTNVLKESDIDKAIGSRLALAGDGPLEWNVGVSTYSGRYTDYKERLDYSGEFNIKRETTVRYYETAFAMDLSLAWGPWLLQAEAALNWRNYHDAFRERDRGGAILPDRVAWGGYAMLVYRLPFDSFNLRPFFTLNGGDVDDNDDESQVIALSAGLNWRIVPPVVFKLQYDYVGYSGPLDSLSRLSSQLAVAF